jgi:hypothetical protein
VQVSAQDRRSLPKDQPITRHNKGHYNHFTVPVLDQSVSINVGLVPGPAFCPGAGTAERPQEKLYEWTTATLKLIYRSNLRSNLRSTEEIQKVVRIYPIFLAHRTLLQQTVYRS